MKLVSIPANPVPDNAVSGSIKTPDGVTLRFARWAPPPGRRGTVVILQGRAEFIEKYFETVRDLRARGFAVATLDWRGQGLSDRPLSDRHKGHVRNFGEYATDLDAFMEQVVLPDCPPPIFALGHSMGGAIAIRACHDGRRWFERVVLSAPMIALPSGRMMGLAAPLARALRLMGRGGAYVPALRARLRHRRLHRQPRHLRSGALCAQRRGAGGRTRTRPRPADRRLGRFRVAADEAFRSASSYAAQLRQPILLVAAGRDQVVSTAAIETFGSHLLAGRHLIIAGSMHEILQEQDHYRDQFWAAFDAFVPGTPLF